MKDRLLIFLCVLILTGGVAAQDSNLSATEIQPKHPAQKLESRATSVSALPPGTAIRIKLDQALSTSRNHLGDNFSGRVTEAVAVNGRTVIPAESSLTGRIVRKSEPRRFAGHPSLTLRPEKIVLSNGETFPIDASVVDTATPFRNKVSDEGRISGPAISSKDKIDTVALTGIGAVTGAVVAGPAGSLIGAAAGASVSFGHYLTKRHSMELPAGTVLVLELNAPVQIAKAPIFAEGAGQ